MGNDPNIAEFDPNGCLWIDQPKPSPYWLSPNVIMTTKAMDPSDVYPGANTNSVTVSWKAGCQFSGVAGELNTPLFDLYIGDPFIAMAPASMSLLTGTPPGTAPAQPAINSGQLNVQTSVGPWQASTIPHLSQPHHACLLARVYPFGATPDTGDLSGYPAVDPHYAQHNCTVNTISGQGMLRIPIIDGTTLRGPQLVVIQAVPDLKPNRTVLDAVLPSLKLIPGFKQIAATPPRSVDFDLGAFTSPHDGLLDKVDDWLEKDVIKSIEDLEDHCRTNHGKSARLILPPNHFAKFDFIVDLTGAKQGDAHICHLSQVKPAARLGAARNGKVEQFGGITVATVVI